MNDIKDVKLPVDTPFSWGWMAIAILFLVIAVIVFLILRHRKPQPKPAPTVIILPPWAIALQKLDALSDKKYHEQGRYKVFFMELSDIVRRYLEERFAIKAPEMTTEEFLGYVQHSPKLNEAQKKSLKGFLDGCDLVKFAKHMPTVDEAVLNFKLAKSLVEETRE